MLNLFQELNISRLRGVYDAGEDAYKLARRQIDDCQETAQRSISISTQVLAYKLWVQLNLQLFEFYKNANPEFLASSFETSRYQFEADIQKKQEGILEDTKAVIAQGMRIATSSDQVWFEK